MILLHEEDGSFLDSLLSNFNIIKIAMMIKAPLWFQSFFPSQKEQSNVSPYFLVNAFGLFVTFGIIIINSMFLKAIEKACKVKEWRAMKRILKNINSVFIFTAFVLFANSATVLPYFYIVQFQNLDLNSVWSYISFGVSIFLLFLYTIFVGYIIYLVNHIPEKGFRNYVKKWKYCEMLFAGFEEHSIFTKLFFVIYILVSIGSSTATSLFGEISVSNGIVQLVLTIATFLYVYITQPLKNFLNNYQLLFLQTLAIIKYGYIIWLSVIKDVHKSDDILYMIDKLATLILIIFLTVKLTKEMKEIKRLLDEQPKRSKVIWVNLCHVIIQQFGMGFEHSKVPKFYKDHIKEGVDEETDLSPQTKQESFRPMLKN